jgi:hypothetical protein
MTTTFSSRSVLLALGLGFALSVACFDESVLVNEDCGSNADCAKNQECVQTEYQAMASNETNYGWCRPEGEGCALGIQPGCECLREGSLYSCTIDYEMVLCPSSQEEDCRCLFPTDLEPPAPNNDACPSS